MLWRFIKEDHRPRGALSSPMALRHKLWLIRVIGAAGVAVGAEGHLVTRADLPVTHLEHTTRVTLRER